MIRPFHTLPDIMELGLLVARIQNESGADRDIDAAVMSLFFTRDGTIVGWVHPNARYVCVPLIGFTGSIDATVGVLHEFLPESSWMIQAPSEQPATALVKNGATFKARTALTPERALLTAFLCLADEIQREAA